MSKSLWQMVKCRWREFRREPSAFFFVVLMPLVWMGVLGLAFSEKPASRYMEDLPEVSYIHFLIPGLLALSFLTTSMFGTGMTLVSNRRENLLKRYLVTPMSPYEYIISHMVGRLMIMSVELGVIWLAGWVFFGFEVRGSVPLFVSLCVLGTSAFTALGVLCGSQTRNSSTYHGMSNLITLPMMMLSGVWFTRMGFPEWLSGLAKFLPLSVLVDSLRKVAIGGMGLSSVGQELSVLLVYLVVCTIFAKRLFRWV